MGSSHFQHFRASASPKEYSLKWVLLLRVSLQTCKVFRNFSTPFIRWPNTPLPVHTYRGGFTRLRLMPPTWGKSGFLDFWIGILGPGTCPKWSWGPGRHFDKVWAQTEPPGPRSGRCLYSLEHHCSNISPNVNLYFLKSLLYPTFWPHHPSRLLRLAELVWLNLRKIRIALFRK